MGYYSTVYTELVPEEEQDTLLEECRSTKVEHERLLRKKICKQKTKKSNMKSEA